MSLLRERIRLIRETRRLYSDHFDSVGVWAQTTDNIDNVSLAAIKEAENQAVQDIIEATTLDNPA